MRVICAILAGALLSGCVASISDRHYFAAVDKKNNKVVNVFRVSMSGGAQLTNARYIAGYYDERAVDLFFNEVKAGTLSTDKGADRIFSPVDCTGLDVTACKAKRDVALAVLPVGRDRQENGAFVMILSTSADAIANTIGAFSESDLAVQSVLYLATKDVREQAATTTAISTTVKAQRRATVSGIDALLKLTPTDNAGAEQQYLAVLRAAAAGVSPAGAPNFTTIDEARAWFATQPRSVAP